MFIYQAKSRDLFGLSPDVQLHFATPDDSPLIEPDFLGGNTNAPSMMIAEKATDLIRASHAARLSA